MIRVDQGGKCAETLHMRVIGIVTELRHPPGLYMREGIAPTEEVAKAWQAAGQAGAVAAGGALVAGIWGAVFLGPLVVTLAAFIPAYQLAHRLLSKPPPLVRVEGGLGSGEATEPKAIVMASRLLGGAYSDYDSPLFHGLFRSGTELRKVMEAEGGNVDLVIVDQATANATFKHSSGGLFSTGIYLPHPKDPSVLLAARNYEKDLVTELRSEWVQTFEALGAKEIVIGEVTKSKAKASGSKDGVAAEMRAAYGTESVDASTYLPGTWDPTRAVHGRRLLRDSPLIWSIVEGRIHGNQLTWRRTIQVDASFGVDVGVLKLWSVGLKIDYEQKFDFFVEFHPKK